MIQGIVVFKIRILIYGIVGFEEYSDSWVRIKNRDSDIRNSWVRNKIAIAIVIYGTKNRCGSYWLF